MKLGKKNRCDCRVHIYLAVDCQKLACSIGLICTGSAHVIFVWLNYLFNPLTI